MMAATPRLDSTTSEQPSSAATRTNRHAEFYFTDEMTVFQVESRLFRVHRHFLAENSLIFSSMFSLPRGQQQVSSTGDAEGTCDANPIYLSGVTELEFETLLRFFYKSIYDDFTLSQESWVALLSIAHRYEFLNVRERAIREIYNPIGIRQKQWGLSGKVKREKEIQQALEQHDYQPLISVAEKYDVPFLDVLPLLLYFVVREQPLTEGEVMGFSALTVSRIAHAREDLQRALPLQMGWQTQLAKEIEIIRRIWKVQNDG